MKRFLFVIACSLLFNNIAFANEDNEGIYVGKTKLNKEQMRRLKNLKIKQAMVVNDGKSKYVIRNEGAKSIASYISFEFDFLWENQYHRDNHPFIDSQIHRNTFNIGFSMTNETYFYIHKQFFNPYIGPMFSFAFIDASNVSAKERRYAWLHDFFNIGLRIGNVFYFKNRNKNPTCGDGIGVYVNAGFDSVEYVNGYTERKPDGKTVRVENKNIFGYGYFIGGGIDYHVRETGRIGLFYKMSHIMWGDTFVDDIGSKMINFKQLSIHTIGLRVSVLFPAFFER